ncbi:CvpA family protein [Candidatus Trichorickettsia mobilis]|uniref:CvpA family protein n=1 Tax=Candidatus Trichorickettsia mobilis TaxID=1346319 RepID=A0ABZ0URE8_9RICK|nr:CvpA family protein [Candidatus Trichorickettsia mobilis]WPY00617.1 CvpA family protein [Candidatus Trichorickettsia mobilis]
MNLSIFDIIVLTIITTSSMLGMYRGLIKLSISFVAFMLSFLAAYFLYPFVELILVRYLDSAVVIMILSSISSYLISLLILGVVTAKLHIMVENISGGIVDRFLGLVAGFIRGGIIVVIIFVIITILASTSYLKAETMADIIQHCDSEKHPKWLTNSLTSPYLEQTSSGLISFISISFLESIKLPKPNKTMNDSIKLDNTGKYNNTAPKYQINPELQDALERELDDLLIQ